METTDTAPTLTFGQWLKQRRNELGLTQEGIADAAGYSPETIRKIEAGQRRPSHQIAEQLADLLQVEPQERRAFVLWARGISDERPPTTDERHASVSARSPVAGRPSSLPVLPTPLIGRERELAHVKALLWRSTTRLVTLLGPPGIGKTSLGIALAWALQADFKDGLLYVPLAPVSDHSLVAATLAEALGVRETSARSLVESLQDALRAKQMLLILDNFEQVVAAAPLVSDLLSAAPQLKVLVTSRAPLHLRGEKLVDVPTLETPDPEQLPSPEKLGRIGSVALFVERVSDAKGDFDLTPENAPTVAAICARLDGLPLAIELAAAKTRLLSLPTLLSRLGKQLTLLTGGPRDAPLYHHTLRESLNFSYRLLGINEQRVFRRLGIFAGPFTLEAAERVAGATIEGLEAIVDQSLLHVREQTLAGAGIASRNGEYRDSDIRFSMLVPVREFAIEQMEAAEEQGDVALDHAHYFLDLGLVAEEELKGPNQKRWYEEIEADYSDIRTVLNWTLKNEQTEIALRLAAAIRFYWQIRGYRQEGIRWLEQALAQSKDVPNEVRAWALNALGGLLYRRGELRSAERAISEAIKLSRDVGKASGLMYTLTTLSTVLTDLGEFERAVQALQEVILLAEKEGDKSLVGKALSTLGLIASRQGNQAEALSWEEQSLVIRPQLGVPVEIAMGVTDIGAIALKLGDYRRAIACAEEGAAICAEIGNKASMIMALGVIGKASLKLGDYERAATNFGKCLTQLVELDAMAKVAFVFEEIGRVAIATGQPARAVRLFGKAEAVRESVDALVDPSGRAERDEDFASLREALSEQEFKAAWMVGRAMPLDEAIAYAKTVPTASG